MSSLNYPIALVAGLLLIGPASAQPAVSPAGGQTSPVRIQTSIMFFLPSSASDDQPQKIEQARKLVYQMATRECDILRDTIAKECRLESINSNIRQSDVRAERSQQQPEGYHVNGAIRSVISLK